MRSRRDNIWSPAETVELVRGFHAGTPQMVMAHDLRKTQGGIRWKLRSLGLIETTEGEHKVHYENTSLATKTSDLQFQLALLRAVKRGDETCTVGIIKSKDVRRYVRTVRGENPTPTGMSIAGECVDLGEKGGFFT